MSDEQNNTKRLSDALSVGRSLAEKLGYLTAEFGDRALDILADAYTVSRDELVERIRLEQRDTLSRRVKVCRSYPDGTSVTTYETEPHTRIRTGWIRPGTRKATEI